jgi:hypothetical protein
MDSCQQGRVIAYTWRVRIINERRADISGAEVDTAESCVRPKAGGTGKYCAVKDEKGNLANIAVL